jgi:MFS family permease
VSALGTGMSTFAFPLVVLYATGSVGKAGLIGSANLVGMLISMLWGGALADRVSRRAVLVAGPIVQAIVLGCVAVLVAMHRAQIPVLALAALLGGTVAAVVMGSSSPALRRIVPAEQLPTASAQGQARDMAVQLVASPVSGFLIAVVRWLPFGADAVSYLFAAVGAALIRRPLGPDAQDRRETTMIKDIAAGVRFVRRQPFLRFGVIAGSLVNLTSTAFLLLLMALVRYRGGGSTQVGFVMMADVAGGLVGAVIAPTLVARLGAPKVVAIAIWSYVISIAVVALVPTLWEIAAVLLIASIATTPVVVVLQSYSMRVVPDEYVGREAAVSRFAVYALMWTGPLLAGWLVTLAGVRGGILLLLVLTVPIAISVQASKSMHILRLPIDQVQPAPVEPSAVVAAPE